jgi:hypothetical protein
MTRGARPVQRGGPVPVACIAGHAGQAEAGGGQGLVVAVAAADAQPFLERGPRTVQAQHHAQAQQCHGVLIADLPPGVHRRFEASPGSGDIPGVRGCGGSVVLQQGVSEVVAGSFGTGDRLGVQRQRPDRVQRADGHQVLHQAPAQQDVVAQVAGALDRFLPGRQPSLQLAREETGGAQVSEGRDEQPVIAQAAGDLDGLPG